MSSNPLYTENATATVFNDSDGVSRMNFSAHQLVDLKKMFIFITITGESVRDSNKYDTSILNSKVDSCNVAKGIFGNFVIRVFSTTMGNYSNYKFTCPQKKGFYFIANLPLIETYMPQSIIRLTGRYATSIVLKGKVTESKPFSHILTIKFFAERG